MKNIYNALSDDYDKLFNNNIEQFVEKANKNREYAIFYPSFGIPKGAQSDFLIYGQAVKGWGSLFNSSDELNKEQLINYAKEFSNDYYQEENHSPLDWVNIYWGKSYDSKFENREAGIEFYPHLSYSTSRSFFWNVTYKLICRYYGLDENGLEWSKKLVWSNLYKIAPAENRNPNDKECEWQQQISIELIRKEIEEIKPKFCIVLTNDTWWEPFRKNLKTEILQNPNIKNGIIESIESYNGSKIIVTTRPFSGSSDKHVNEILELIK